MPNRRHEKITVSRRGVIHYQDTNPLGIPCWTPRIVLFAELTADELQDLVYHAANAVSVAQAKENKEYDRELF